MNRTVINKLLILSAALDFTFNFSNTIPIMLKYSFADDHLAQIIKGLNNPAFNGIAIIIPQYLVIITHQYDYLTVKVKLTDAQVKIGIVGNQRTIYFYRSLIEECFGSQMTTFKIIDTLTARPKVTLPAIQLPYNTSSGRALYQSLISGIKHHDRATCVQILQQIAASNRQFNNAQAAALPPDDELTKYLVVSILTVLTQTAILANLDPSKTYQLSDRYLASLSVISIPALEYIAQFLDELLTIPPLTSEMKSAYLNISSKKISIKKLRLLI